MVEVFGQSLSLVLAIAGAALVVAEALAPGAHFIVLGVALLLAGLLGLALGSVVPATVLPLVLAGAVLGVGAATFYVYREFDFYGGKGTDQTRDSTSLRGTTGRVTEDVSPTGGEVKLEGGGFNPYFRARTVDGEIPEGKEVMVTDPGGGNLVTVESLSIVEDDIDRKLDRGREREQKRKRERAADAPEPDRETRPETETDLG
ncbi:protease [Halobacteriales archaeon QS_8_65_32]|nr:MAG: protease [Halobacteriales archaeon QS_8_65_32]